MDYVKEFEFIKWPHHKLRLVLDTDDWWEQCFIAHLIVKMIEIVGENI